jgi:hypothetical protein
MQQFRSHVVMRFSQRKSRSLPVQRITIDGFLSQLYHSAQPELPNDNYGLAQTKQYRMILSRCAKVLKLVTSAEIQRISVLDDRVSVKSNNQKNQPNIGFSIPPEIDSYESI